VTDSDAALAAAVRADLVAMMALLHEPPFGEVHAGPEAIWFLTGRSEPAANGVLHAELDVHDPGASIQRLLEPFRSHGVPMTWWRFTPPEPSNGTLDAALRRHGLALESDRPGFGLELRDLRPVRPPAGARVERVWDPDAFASWAWVVGLAFGDPAFADGPSVRAFQALGFGDDAPFIHVVCRIGDEAVGAATLSRAAGVAGLGNIAVVPGRRGEGLGATVASAALVEARTLGLEVAGLSSDPLGVALYRKLGFREVSRHLTYVWHPER